MSDVVVPAVSPAVVVAAVGDVAAAVSAVASTVVTVQADVQAVQATVQADVKSRAFLTTRTGLVVVGAGVAVALAGVLALVF